MISQETSILAGGRSYRTILLVNRIISSGSATVVPISNATTGSFSAKQAQLEILHMDSTRDGWKYNFKSENGEKRSPYRVGERVASWLKVNLRNALAINSNLDK
jgi:hypothetical protein